MRMMTRTTPRPGGRSARVQAAVHLAVHELEQQHGRAALTVPLIAARAGVTPSTIYRRWGDLGDLLADVALERLRGDPDPADTGTVRGDLQVWAEQYLEEMSSSIGLSMMRDVVASSQRDEQVACQCAAFTAGQVAQILARGTSRGQAVPSADAVMDGVVAPIIYRALFGPAPASHAHVRSLVADCLKRANLPARTA